MQNTYYIAVFTKPDNFAQTGYMVVDQSGNVSFTDSSGNQLTLPFVCEYDITSPEPQFPSWGV